MNIISPFLEAAAKCPEGIALVQGGQSITYKKLQQEVMATAALYQELGIGAGDKVLVFVPMSLPLYRVVLALFYIGACPVFLDEWVSISRLKACLEVVPCKAIIALPRFLFLSRFIAPFRRIQVKIDSSKKSTSNPGLTAPAEVSGEDTALVTFTTGSTGIPKAANRTHAYLFAQLEALRPILDEVESPCTTMLPIVVLLHLATGKAAILPPRRFKASKPLTVSHLTNAITVSRPASLIASPAIVSAVIQDASTSSNPRILPILKAIKAVITGGGPVYPNLAEQMTATFPDAVITALYGSTEAEPISHIDGKELAAATLETLIAKGLPVGKPDEAAQVAILALDISPDEIVNEVIFKSKLLPPEAVGEVIVSGPHVLKHYINNPAAEAQTKLFIGDEVWHRTGDCGRIDEEGRLYLLGRCSEMFAWKGIEYYPAIISYGIQVLTGVQNSALLLRDNVPWLILERTDKSLLEKVESTLHQFHLQGAAVHFVNRIPKDPRHQTKVDYLRLDSMLR